MMRMGEWMPAPQALVDRFAACVAGFPAQQRKMFGYPAAFVNGNMFAGLFRDRLILKLPQPVRMKLFELPGAAPFEPMPGRVMGEFVVLPASLLDDPGALRAWVQAAFDYVATFPAKTRKPSRK